MPEGAPLAEPRPGPGLCHALPHLPLSRLPTPLDDLPRIAAVLGVKRLLVKREDLTGVGLGGNKPRKLDFILADAVARGCDAVVTTAGVQSNFCRATAAAVSSLGMRTVLLLRGSGTEERQGNLLLHTLFGATLRFLPQTDPWDPEIARSIEEAMDVLRREGRRPYAIQLTGRTGPLATAAYVAGAEELADQLAAAGIGRAAVYVACGSGLTLAGLTLGFKHMGLDIRPIGISVQQPAARLLPWIVAQANAAGVLLGLETRIDWRDFDLFDDYVGPGYAVPTAAALAAIRLFGSGAGILLDPVYTGKGVAGMIDRIRAGAHRADEAVIFIHSGGTPGVFAHAAAFAEPQEGSP